MTDESAPVSPGERPDPFGDLEYAAVPRVAAPRDREVWPPKPGIFAAVWPVYLLVGAVAAASPFLSAKYVDDSIALPAVRSIVSAFVIGLTVLLALLRLSQSRSSDPVVESAMDAFSLLLPVQPLIWFTVVRPIGLSADRVLATDLSMIGWTTLVAGVVGLTLARERGDPPDAARRMLGMLLVICLQCGGPAAFAAARSVGLGVDQSLLGFGPVASVLGLLESPRSPVPAVAWIPVASVWFLSMGVWWIGLAERRKVIRGGESSLGLSGGS